MDIKEDNGAAGTPAATPTPRPGVAPTPVKKPTKQPAKPAPRKKPGTPAAPTRPGMPADFGSQGLISAANPDPSAKSAVYGAIARAASELGVPLALALAMAQQESGFNARSVGDHGTSFGLYQLHKGGELTSAGLTADQAYDPYTNAKVALAVVASVLKQHPNYTWGQVAAAAQRPADKAGYAKSVDGILGAAQKNPDYFVSRVAGASQVAVPAGATSGTGVSGGSITAANPDPKTSIATYGYIAALAKKEPDLAALMTKYAGEDLSVPAVRQRLEADIQNTVWWKSHNDSYRTAEILRAQDPAQYQANLHAQLSGIRSLANEYMIPMSDPVVLNWADRIASGRMTQDDYQNYLKEQAKSMFPGMGTAIDAGVTPTAYTDPYRQLAAQTLEIPPDSVNFQDPKWGKALFQTDPKTGARTSMSLADWQTTLRSDSQYGFDKTQAARTTASDLTAQLAKTFGAMG